MTNEKETNQNTRQTPPNKNTITRGQWDEQGYPMVWSITDKESNTKFEEETIDINEGWIQAFDQVLLDMSAPQGAPDGTHCVYEAHHKGYAYGAEIKDGDFVPGPTVNAVFSAACQSYDTTPEDVLEGQDGIDDVYIERFEWDHTLQALRVTLGS